MPCNAEFSTLMKTIMGSLLPLCEREANPELWFIYDEMQRWEMLAGNKIPPSSVTELVQTANVIKQHAARLADQKLATAIHQALAG